MLNAAAALSPSELVLGRYRPLHPLGSGGSGSVWLARDEPTGVEVALKIVPREGKAASRAEREVAAAARLRHERCLRAYSLARDERHVYIAYEYVAGCTLRQALRAGALDDRSALEAVAQICDGLAHAHAHGIVHRDVKPANVLVADEEEVSIRLLDFGLALLTEAETLTAAGDVPGTLAYISPERLRGDTATAAADIWATGVLLWESLAGEHPFWSGSLLDTARLIEQGAPSIAQARPDLPRRLVELVDRALALEARRRPSATKLATGLRLAAQPRRRSRKAPPQAPDVREVLPRAAHAGLAALTVGWTASALPFYPGGWTPGLAAVAALLAFARERAGFAFALAVPVLPLGNISLGLALLYAAIAAGWLALSWRAPREGLLFGVGPLLGPLGALGLLPLAGRVVRSPARRAATVAAAVMTAGIVAGIGHHSLPFTGAVAPALGIDGTRSAGTVAAALRAALAARPELPLEALALAAGAAALPFAVRRGPWGIAGFGAALLAVTLLIVPSVDALPLVAAVWTTCLVLVSPPPAVLRERLLRELARRRRPHGAVVEPG